MSVQVIDTLKPKNNGTFPIVDAEDVSCGTVRRPEALNGKADKSALDATNAALAGKASTADVTAATNNLQGQIDQIVIASATEYVVAPEVAQARVDSEGVTHDTLNDRIDSDITFVKENQLYVGTLKTSEFGLKANGAANGFEEKNGVRTTADGYVDNASYTSFAITLNNPAYLYYIPEGSTSSIVEFWLFDGTPDTSTYKAKYSIANEDLPTKSEPIRIPAGYTLSICKLLGTSEVNIGFTNSFELNENVILSNNQISQIESEIGIDDIDERITDLESEQLSDKYYSTGSIRADYSELGFLFDTQTRTTSRVELSKNLVKMSAIKYTNFIKIESKKMLSMFLMKSIQFIGLCNPIIHGAMLRLIMEQPSIVISSPKRTNTIALTMLAR